jgi:hypothetical protein
MVACGSVALGAAVRERGCITVVLEMNAMIFGMILGTYGLSRSLILGYANAWLSVEYGG